MMLRIVIIFGLGIITIPHIQSRLDVFDSKFSRDLLKRKSIDSKQQTLTTTAVPFKALVNSINPTPLDTTDLIDSTTSIYSTTPIPFSLQISSDATVSISMETTEQTTTKEPINVLFRCDFTELCFGHDLFTITNGSEFIPVQLSATTESPIAPTSDVTSIITSTNNNETCKLPYRLKLNSSNETTPWNMWFCYNNQCPTKNHQQATCTSGLYGLLPLNLSETVETTIDFFDSDVLLQDSIGDRCLRFYYYFTVYNQTNWGQQIQIWIRSHNKTDNEILLQNLTISTMRENKWELQELTFNSIFSSHSLVFIFKIDNYNQTIKPHTNKTIYFALDNIELYDHNCSYITESITTLATTSSVSTTSIINTTVTTEDTETPPPPPGSGLGTILGLSLGIGIPVLLIVLGGIILYNKKEHGTDNDSYHIPLSSSRGRSDSDIFFNPYLF